MDAEARNVDEVSDMNRAAEWKPRPICKPERRETRIIGAATGMLMLAFCPRFHNQNPPQKNARQTEKPNELFAPVNSLENSSIAAIGIRTRAEYKGTVARSIFSSAGKSSGDLCSVHRTHGKAALVSVLSVDNKAAARKHAADASGTAAHFSKGGARRADGGGEFSNRDGDFRETAAPFPKLPTPIGENRAHFPKVGAPIGGLSREFPENVAPVAKLCVSFPEGGTPVSGLSAPASKLFPVQQRRAA